MNERERGREGKKKKACRVVVMGDRRKERNEGTVKERGRERSGKKEVNQCFTNPAQPVVSQPASHPPTHPHSHGCKEGGNG